METIYFNLSTSLLFLILAFILFVKRSPYKKPNIFLGVLFIIMAFYSELIYLHLHFVETKNINSLTSYLPIDALLMMLMSPCLYFYILSLLYRPVKLMRWTTLWHILPLLPCVLFLTVFSFKPATDRANWLIHDYYYGSREMIFINIILYLQIVFYLMISYLAVNKQKKVSVYVEKNGFRTNITWIQLFLLVNILITLISLPLSFWMHNEQSNIFIGHMAMNINLIFLFIMSAQKISSLDTEKMEEKKISYQISENMAVNYWKTLMAYMDTHKPYLDENCSLHSLALQTNIPEYQLSKLLNIHGGKSFADFINDYRVKEAVIYLQDRSEQQKKIDTIALECGFGSRSTFYRAFEKVYSVSPAIYRKQYDTNQHD